MPGSEFAQTRLPESTVRAPQRSVRTRAWGRGEVPWESQGAGDGPAHTAAPFLISPPGLFTLGFFKMVDIAYLSLTCINSHLFCLPLSLL